MADNKMLEGVDAFVSLIGEALASSAPIYSQQSNDLLDGVNENSSDSERTAALGRVLEELARSPQEDVEARADRYVEFFKILYKANDDGSHFRHKYSDVCGTLYSFFQKDVDAYGEIPEAVVWLEDNMKYVVEQFKMAYGSTGELGSVIKLQDHISLEVIRLSHQTDLYRDHCQQIVQLRDEVDARTSRMLDDVRQTEEKVKRIDKSADAMQRQYITILGILASVVLAFNGGITFSVTSINAVYGYHPFRIALIVFVVGFVLYNLMFALFTFLLKATGDRCEEASSCPTADGRQSFLNALWGRSGRALLVVPNVVLIAGIVFSFVFVLDAYDAVL